MRTRTLVLALASLGVTACSSASPGSSNVGPATDAGVPIDQAAVSRDAPSPSALGPAVAANNAFAIDLYEQVAPTVDGGNLITSPLSASFALTMAYAGAEGQTATEMAAALQLPADASSAFAGQNALSQALASRAAAALASDTKQAQGSGTAPSPADYAFQVVNSVWGEKTYPWAAPFLGVLAQNYGTGVYLEDFITNYTGATQTINDWVSNETVDKINDLIPQGAIDDTTRMVLVNAVHLKLPWASPFQASLTANGTFTRGDGTTVIASFMNQTFEEGNAGYAETAQAQVVSLPLSDNQLSVVFVLPKSGGLANLVSSLTPETWSTLTATTAPADGIVLSLPKFDFTSPSFSLKSPLEALGMKTAFDPVQANFKGLCAAPPDGDNLYVSDVLQKAMMTVAENGVEAAAATAVIVGGLSAVTQPVVVTINQPFLVSIVDSSGAIVFLGQIDDPTDTGSP
jgi:serpin B